MVLMLQQSTKASLFIISMPPVAGSWDLRESAVPTRAQRCQWWVAIICIIVRVKHLDYIAEISQFIYLEIVFSHIKCFQASESPCRVWSWVSRWRPHTSTTTKSDSSASQPSQVTDTNILFLVLVFETFIYRCYKYLLLDESNATIVMWEWCVLDRAGKRTFAKFEVEQPRAFAWLKVPTNY